MSPVELRARLNELKLERLAAADVGLTRHDEYMADLEAEVAECLDALTLTTVTEIAMFRRELAGPQVG
jgi:hypothetical protein